MPYNLQLNARSLTPEALVLLKPAIDKDPTACYLVTSYYCLQYKLSATTKFEKEPLEVEIPYCIARLKKMAEQKKDADCLALYAGMLLSSNYQDWGVENDHKKAMRYYRLAEDKGSIEGTYGLGFCYCGGLADGGLTPVNIETGISLIEKAAWRGYTPAVKMLIKIYTNGINTNQDEISYIDPEKVKFWTKQDGLIVAGQLILQVAKDDNHSVKQAFNSLVQVCRKASGYEAFFAKPSWWQKSPVTVVAAVAGSCLLMFGAYQKRQAFKPLLTRGSQYLQELHLQELPQKIPSLLRKWRG